MNNRYHFRLGFFFSGEQFSPFGSEGNLGFRGVKSRAKHVARKKTYRQAVLFARKQFSDEET